MFKQHLKVRHSHMEPADDSSHCMAAKPSESGRPIKIRFTAPLKVIFNDDSIISVMLCERELLKASANTGNTRCRRGWNEGSWEILSSTSGNDAPVGVIHQKSANWRRLLLEECSLGAWIVQGVKVNMAARLFSGFHWSEGGGFIWTPPERRIQGSRPAVKDDLISFIYLMF